MADRFYLVELRCATCGVIFCSSMTPVHHHKVDEYKRMFEAKGPERFIQCKNKCPRWKQGAQPPIESPFRQPINTNQKVEITEIPAQELRERGLMH